MSLEVRAEPDGASFAVRVIPRGQPEGPAGLRDGRLVVRVGAPAVDGRANQRLLALLAARLGVARRAVSLVAGERSRDKRVAVRGAAPEAVLAALEQSA